MEAPQPEESKKRDTYGEEGEFEVEDPF